MVEKPPRIIIIVSIFLIVLGIFVLQMIKLQLIDGDDYLKQSLNSVLTTTRVKASRGEILDRFCSPIVRTTSVMDVEFNRSLIKDLNGTISSVIDIFEKSGDSYYDTFPVSKTEPYIFYEDFLSSESKVTAFSKWLKNKKIEPEQTAEDVLAALVKYYKLSDYPLDRARNIIAVRYEIERNSSGYFYTFAEEVSLETATMVKERSADIPGVTVEMDSVRSYVNENFERELKEGIESARF